MNLRFVCFALGLMLAAISAFMLIPARIDFNAGNLHNAGAFLGCGLGGFFLSSMMALVCSNYGPPPGQREGFLLTTVAWVAASFLASLPLHFTDIRVGYIDAFFEAVSGITTTGATILSGLDKMSPGILIWRSLIEWIGGMGVIGLAIMFLPLLRVGGMQLFLMESSDKSEKAMPRTAKLVTCIFMVYCGLTLACAITYRVLGMSWFDAINHAMTTLPTAGYSTHDASFGYFNSPALEWAGVFFMILSALPFILYIKLFLWRNMDLFRNSQIRAFLCILAGVTAILTLWLVFCENQPAFQALTKVAFNITSVITTTGFASTDYLQWGTFPAIVFLFVTYLGACSGSTAGGIKIMRLQIAARQSSIQIRRLFYPHGVFMLNYEGKPVSDSVLRSVLVFLSLYVLANAVLTLLITATGVDFITALSGAATALGNVGPGLGEIIGPAGNFAPVPAMAKLLLCAGMILGRLELLTVLVLLHPSFWKR